MNGITTITRDNYGFSWVRTFADAYRCVETNEVRHIGELVEMNGRPMEFIYV